MVCAFKVYTVDKVLAQEQSKSIFFAGMFLQSYWIYIVFRDILITLNSFIRGRNEAFALVIALHYVTSCLDNLLMGGLLIWSSISLGMNEATGYAEAPDETGMPAFLTVLTINVIIGYLYVCSHICACPITIFIVSRDPQRYGFAMRRAEDLDDDELDLL